MSAIVCGERSSCVFRSESNNSTLGRWHHAIVIWGPVIGERECVIGEGELVCKRVQEKAESAIWRMESLCFEKQLTETDVSSYLEIPEAAQYLPPGDEAMQVVDENGYVWQFKASVTTTGRRCLTQQWHNFVAVASPRNGDTLKYYRLFNQNVYLVKLQRKPALRLFGVDIYV
ncbi:hypothetical protein F0562_025799 [Nyssa sinensis]|uniref:TF-B3 domain-containing protein n=1 Tax=Nyssa sinensis TaxID=561372 RepID=A0A5J5BBH8_9ASTE|nr:hypothetical protein F0562_025799 [Nyssa sinensis]